MSQENVEIVSQVYEAVVRGEWELAGEMLDPDIEFHGTVGGLGEGTVARGVEQIRYGLEHEDLEAWDERRFEPEKFIDAGDCVVVLQREFRRGRASGVELQTDTAVVCEVRNGRVVRLQGFMDRAEALEAAGLRE
jgi:ketosteroid isomerase-like protein